MPSKGLPTDTYFGSNLKLAYFFNGEGVELLRIPAAATDGDSVVHFRGSDVIATGELFDFTRFPLIDIAKGGSIQGVLAGLNRMVEMAVPEFRSEGGTLFIPAHGRVGDIADMTYYRDMTTIIRDRIQDLMKKGTDARADQGGAADGRLGWPARPGQVVDAGHVRRGDLQGPAESQKVRVVQAFRPAVVENSEISARGSWS